MNSLVEKNNNGCEDDHGAARTVEFNEERLTIAMASAMRQVLTDPAVIEQMGAVAVTIIQKQAAEKTGNFLWSALKAIFTRWIVIAFLLLALGQIVGFPRALQVFIPVVGKSNP